MDIHLSKDSKNIALGAIIGAVVGIGAMSLLCTVRHGKRSSLDMIGDAVAHVGDMLDGKKCEKHRGIASDVIEWTVAGLQIWNKMKRGT